MNTKIRLANQFQALGDETRLQIIRLISRGTPSATDLNRALGMSQPRVAHHLKVLVDADLILAVRDGRFVRYSLPSDPLPAALTALALDALGVRPGARQTGPSPNVEAGRVPAPGPGSRPERRPLVEAGAAPETLPAADQAREAPPEAKPRPEQGTEPDPEPEAGPDGPPPLEDYLL